MEHAPLRPVPPRPEGPVDPAEAHRHVAAQLPDLDSTAAAALALVEVARRPRAAVAAEANISPEELADVLARARKALRRSVQPLPGSGWCERVERYISDRLDEELEAPGLERLGVHLANCPRCVEHELRLAQATEALMRGFVEGHPGPGAPPAAEPSTSALEAPAPELVLVPPAEPEPEAAAAAAEVAAPSAPAVSRRIGERLTALAWHGLFVLAMLLAVAAIVLALIGVIGGEL